MSKSLTYLDGGFGTELQKRGLKPGEKPAEWNVTHPEEVAAVHQSYVDAGSDIIYANTFGADVEYIAPAIQIARKTGKKVALDLAPTGRLMMPMGDMTFDECYNHFAARVKAGKDADLIVIETMTDLKELKCAVLAAKENSKLPIYATVAMQENGTLLTGASVECVANLLEGLDVEAYGFNCGLGPDQLLPLVKRLAAVSSKPIIVKANAGLPQVIDGKTVFTVTPPQFAAQMREIVQAGATIIGGCCGTTPLHVAALHQFTQAFSTSTPLHGKNQTIISSGAQTISLKSYQGTIIGERINPTGKKKLKEALKLGDLAYVLREAVNQIDTGAQILDVNCGVPGIDEAATLDKVIAAVEGITTTPLQIDTSDPVALERALRHVNGKAMVNSVNGKQESMDAVFPIVKKYGGVIVGLCLDEKGIPDTVEGRLAIAQKILDEGAKYGFTKDDFVFDALTLAVSAQPNAAQVTIETVRRLTEEFKVNTVLGVSNVSFGLPNRPALNAAMYQACKKVGLSAAIYNPLASTECDDPLAYDVLYNRDPGCLKWIDHCAANSAQELLQAPSPEYRAGLKSAIKRGLREDAKRLAGELLESGVEALSIIDSEIVPALEEVGKGFEKGTLFLPQLLMSADAAGDAFGVIRKAMTGRAGSPSTPPIIIATVKGDIHDIGKNIVRALLENYGFNVIDLGRDVPPEEIVAAAVRAGSKLVGLSALMTTTVKAMAETIKQLKATDTTIKVFVGGAVLTADYAKEIGADFYTKDAMASVRLAEAELHAKR